MLVQVGTRPPESGAMHKNQLKRMRTARRALRSRLGMGHLFGEIDR